MSFLLPIHILTYGYTFGSTTFHSYVASIKGLEVLPRRQFGQFQSAVLPIQIITQSLAPVVIGATAPYTIPGVGLGLLLASSAGGVINWAWFTPLCNKLKDERWKLVDARFGGDNDKAVASGELKAIDKEFGKWHGMSMAANLLSILSITAYGFVLSGKLRVVP